MDWVDCRRLRLAEEVGFQVGFENVKRLRLAERKRESVPSCRGGKRKGTRANCSKGDAGDLVAERVRSRAESSRWCVQVKKVRKVCRSVVVRAFVAENAEFVKDSFVKGEPMKSLEEWGDMLGFLFSRTSLAALFWIRWRGRSDVCGRPARSALQ